MIRMTAALTLATALVSGCAVRTPVDKPVQRPQPDEPVEAVVPKLDPMADVPGDQPLPLLGAGDVERIDCTDGHDDVHARIAFEAQDGQVLGFAYYSKWKPRTCSLHLERDAFDTKWRMTPDGATRVQTPHGRLLIHTRSDAFVFEFERVQRSKYCGMAGEINGTMTVKRGTGEPQCSAVGILDR